MIGTRARGRDGWAIAALALLAAGCASSASTTTAATTLPVAPTTAAASTTTTAPRSSSRTGVVTTATRTFQDPTRTTPHNGSAPTPGRTLFTMLWLPPGRAQDGPSWDGTWPLILLAHGIGGEPEKFGQLATAWANWGFVVAAPRFPASSTTGGAGIAGIQDLGQQPADMIVVLDGLLADPSLHLDADSVGVAGLSLGGSTIYALATDTCCMDPRIKAAAIFDGLRPEAMDGGSLVPNRIPVLMLHCDEDYRLPYADHAVPGFARLGHPSWLITMGCAEHSEPYEDTPSTLDAFVEATTIDFWNGTLAEYRGALSAMRAAVATSDGAATIEEK